MGSLAWLETCLSETLLPSSTAWFKTVEKFETIIYKVVMPKLGNAIERQARTLLLLLLLALAKPSYSFQRGSLAHSPLRFRSLHGCTPGNSSNWLSNSIICWPLGACVRVRACMCVCVYVCMCVCIAVVLGAQILFELLGPEFVRDHFATLDNNPLILEEPLLPSTKRRKATLQVRRWLKREVSQAIVQAELLVSNDFQSFEAFARERVGVGIDRILAKSTSLEEDVRIIDSNAALLIAQVPQLAGILLPRLLGRTLPRDLRRCV